MLLGEFRHCRIHLPFRLKHDTAFFSGKAFAPFLDGVEHGSAFRLGVIAGKENFLAGVPDSAAAVQRKNDNALAVNAALDLAELHAFRAGFGAELLHTKEGLQGFPRLVGNTALFL